MKEKPKEICYICKRGFMDYELHKHHIRPKVFGGVNKDRITICVGCHKYLHRIINQKIANLLKNTPISFFTECIASCKKELG